MRCTVAGKVALVTGGGGGLGTAVCQNLAAAGATVVALDVNGERATHVATQIRVAGGRCHALRVDLSDERQLAEVVDHVVREHGGLDILINSAGVDVTAPVEELSVADWDRILRINLQAPFVLSKLAFPGMKRAGAGHIVNIVSTAARRAWPNATAYHASKWGLLGLSHALHAEGRSHGVKVTAVLAGGMRTPFLLDRFPELDPELLQDPRSVAETVRFVLSQPRDTVIPEMLVLPMGETSWP